MKKILVGILFYTGCLFAADNIEGIGAGAAIAINGSMKVDTMNNEERMLACKNMIKASKQDQTRPFLENYNQAMKIAINECVKDLK